MSCDGFVTRKVFSGEERWRRSEGREGTVGGRYFVEKKCGQDLCVPAGKTSVGQLK